MRPCVVLRTSNLRLGQEVGGDAREKPTLVLDLSVY
jgi:hypothetical protein